jgi:hypothetical protein
VSQNKTLNSDLEFMVIGVVAAKGGCVGLKLYFIVLKS